VLAVTGIVLSRSYVPDPAVAFDPGLHHLANPAARWMTWHRVASSALLPALIVLLLATLRSRWRLVLALAVAVGLSPAAGITGRNLGWDQLALWAVTVGDASLRGIWHPAFDDKIRFVLTHGTELDKGEYRTTIALHLATLPVAAALAGIAARRHIATVTRRLAGVVQRQNISFPS
jgi:quinol-cytochrome oxidoreductase complex cytochrome b subunit